MHVFGDLPIQSQQRKPSCADSYNAVRCLPAMTRQNTLLKVQDRVTKMLFVELLFEKGPRESDMIQAEYSWSKALLDRSQEARVDNQDANIPGVLQY